MKNLLVSLVFCLVLSFTALADGHMPATGKNCPNSPCLVASTNEVPEGKEAETTFVSMIFKTVLDIFN